MGDCHWSNIAIMQLFHELKQQFPALPDHVVSQCIAQNSYDRETCTKSLLATQESRPPPGAFPPPAPEPVPTRRGMSIGNSKKIQSPHRQHHQHNATHFSKPHRPDSLNIYPSRQSCSISRPRIPPPLPPVKSISFKRAPFSAPATYSPRGFFDELSSPATKQPILNSPTEVKNHSDNNISEHSSAINLNPTTTGFELNVNVACSPVGNCDPRTNQNIQRSDLIIEPRSVYGERRVRGSIDPGPSDLNTRSYTSVSLTLRPPSSEPQPPIDIRSQGSSLTYSTSSLDPRGFQSRLQISIGPGNISNVTTSRLRAPANNIRSNSLIPVVQTQRLQGRPNELQSQLPQPTTTMSAPTTPSATTRRPVGTNSLPTTPSGSQLISSSPSSNFINELSQKNDRTQLALSQVSEQQRELIAQQIARKERLARELAAEEGRLVAMKRELDSLTKPIDSSIPLHELEKRLRSEIYSLQVECDRLTDEVDKRSDPRVPLGETNEEFYKGIYTGQALILPPFVTSQAPPLPSVPPAWEVPQNQRVSNEQDDRDGPSWVCRMCTFDNHPLMDKCEQCDMPRFPVHDAGETQDIHIRVTHHHNFSPRRTVHSWVV